mgnify:FL=1
MLKEGKNINESDHNFSDKRPLQLTLLEDCLWFTEIV